MSYSSGVFTLTSGNPVVTGTTISSTWANNTLSDIATGLSTALLKDGTQTATAAIPFALGLSTPAAGPAVLLGALRMKTPTSTGNNATYTVAIGDFAVMCDSNFTLSITMPNAGTYEGRLLVFVNNNGSQAVNASATVICPLGSASTGSAILSAAVGKWAILQSDGGNWRTLAAN